MIDHSVPSPLRLLLVATGTTIPNWLVRCLDDVEQSGAAMVVLVLRAADGGRQRARSFTEQLRQIAFRLYKNLDRHLFRSLPDALAPADLHSAFPKCRMVDGAGLPDDRLARLLLEERIDVVLDPLSLLPDGSLAERVTHGVWSVTFGQSGDSRAQSNAGFWEVIEGSPGTETRLCVRGNGFDDPRSLYVSVAPTDRRSVSRGQNHVYWKMAATLARKLRLLWEDSEAFGVKLKEAPPFRIAADPSPAPGNMQMLRACAVLVRRYASDKWRDTRYREQWALAYHQGTSSPLEIGTPRILMPPPDRLWADPFPVRVGNEYYVFHEELLFAAGKGSIVATVLDDKGGTVARCIPVLEEDCHLSYPFVFEWAGDLFMTPETASRHQVALYRCVEFPSRWKLERVLLSGLRAFDPTPAFLFGQWWLLATVAAYGAGCMDELHAFHADSPLGPWTPHRSNPIKSDVRSARPAGRIVEHHGQWYRPAQDCSSDYGRAVSINRILRLDHTTYEEAEVERILPGWAPHVVGVHTFNRIGRTAVIDCLVRTRRSRARSRVTVS